MSQPTLTPQVEPAAVSLKSAQQESESLKRLRSQNEELRRYLAAQRSVVASLERRVGRSLESLGVHLQTLDRALQQPTEWERSLVAAQSEVDCLCDLLSDTLLLQKLEAGKIEVHPEALSLQSLLVSVTRHLLQPKDGAPVRLVCEFSENLPPVLADTELTEAVLTDLIGRALKYSDVASPVGLGTEVVGGRACVRVTAQRFAPAGNRDFATEIVLCCRRIEVQGGEIACQPHPDGLQTVTISLPLAA